MMHWLPYVLVIRAVLATAYVAVVVLQTNAVTVDSRDYAEEFTAAVRLEELRSSDADSAPKQQVVAGWGARDLLNVISRRNATVIFNQGSNLRAQQSMINMLSAQLVIGVLSVTRARRWRGTAIDSLLRPGGRYALP